MALDPVKNFAEVEVSTGYNDTATNIVLASGEGAKLPDPSGDGDFNLVWFNKTDYPNPADDPNVEIVRVTAKSTDTLTVTRGQEGTSGSTKNTADKTYYMILSITKKMVDDLSTEFESADSTILKEADVDDVPVDAADVAPISSNWAYDHENASNPHSVDWSDVSGGHDAAAHSGFSVSALSDVTHSSVGNGEVLLWTGGTHWENKTLAEASIAPSNHNHLTLTDETDSCYEMSGTWQGSDGLLKLGDLDTVSNGVHIEIDDENTTIFIRNSNLNLPDLTASYIVETDASKDLASIAKGTAYNKAFGTGSGQVAEGDHTQAVAKGGTGQTTYTDGQLLIGNTSGNTLAKNTLTATLGETTVTNGNGTITLGISSTYKKTPVIGHTWAISGEIKVASGGTDHIIPMPVELPSGQTVKLTMAKWGIYSGTNCNVKLRKSSGFDGSPADITGFTNITVNSTGGSTDPSDVTLADNDYIWLVVNSVSATPTHLHFTIFLEYSV